MGLKANSVNGAVLELQAISIKMGSVVFCKINTSILKNEVISTTGELKTSCNFLAIIYYTIYKKKSQV